MRDGSITFAFLIAFKVDEIIDKGRRRGKVKVMFICNDIMV